MGRHQVIFSILFYFLCSEAQSQVVSRLIADTGRASTYMGNFGGPDHDEGFIVLGRSQDSLFSNWRYTISKLDKNGQLISCLASDSLDFREVVLTSDHGYLFTGVADNSSSQFIMKTDSVMNIQWTKFLRPGICFNILPTYAVEVGGYFYFISFAYCPEDCITLWKLNFAGDILKQRIITDSLDNISWPYRIAASPDSQLVITYYENTRSILMKMDTSFHVLWSRVFEGTAACYPYFLKCYSDSSIVVTGIADDGHAFYRISGSGNIMFTHIFKHSVSFINFLNPVEVPGGETILVGALYDTTVLNTPVFLKAGASGNLLYSYRYNFSNTSSAFARSWYDAGTDSIYILGGFQNVIPVAGSKIIFFRSDTAATSICFSDPIAISDSQIVVVDSFFIPAMSLSNFYLADTLVALYPNAMLVHDLCSWLPDYMQEFMPEGSPDAVIFPNPFHSSATLLIRPEIQMAWLRIYNMLGELKVSLQIKDQKVEISRGLLGDGLYFYEVRNRDYEPIGNGKMVIE